MRLVRAALATLAASGQSVVLVGHGDNRALSPAGDPAPVDRQFFAKLSYAFQR